MVLNQVTKVPAYKRVQAMSVSYDKLWKLLIDRKMSRTELKDASGISFNVLAKMGRNEFVSMESLYKICCSLSCDIGEIMEFTDNQTVSLSAAQPRPEGTISRA